MNRQSQSGFAVIELAIVVVVLAVLGSTSYFVWHQHDEKPSTAAASTAVSPSTSQQPSSISVPTAPAVNNASELNGAMQALNQTDLAANNTDSSQLSTQANGF